MDSTLGYTSGIIFLLSTAIFTFFLSKKSKLPYSVLLVVIGSIIHIFKQNILGIGGFNLTPEILFLVFLPLLLFESAYNIDFHKFKKDLNLITVLASLGVILSAFFIALFLSLILQIDFGISLLFGTIIACTDPIAVISIFKELGVPKRLMNILDGESMLNDGTAVVFSKIILSVLTAGIVSDQIFMGIGRLTWTLSASLLIGISFGWVVSKAIKVIKHQMLIEITMTIILAVGTFLIAEEFFHASGIIATVVAGISFGVFGRNNFSPGVRHLAGEIWEYIAFICNSFVFLLIGITYGADRLIENWKEIVAAFIIVKLGRTFAVYVITGFYNKLKPETKLPKSWVHILNWGGLRGALPIAVIASLEGRQYGEIFETTSVEYLLNITVGVVLLSLLINGTTIRFLIRKLQVDNPTVTEKIHSDLVRILLLNESLEHIEHLSSEGEISENIKQSVRQEQDKERQCLVTNLAKISKEKEIEVKKVLYYHAFQIEKEAFIKLYEKNVIDEKVFNQLKQKLEEGISLIEEGILPSEFSKNKAILALSRKFKKNFTLQELFIYRKARQIANIEVLKKLKSLKEVKALKKPLEEVINAYQKFHDKNKKMCADLNSQDSKKIQRYEKDFCYKEFLASEEKLLKDLNREGKISIGTSKIVKNSLS